MTSADDILGGCNCGHVRYAVRKQPIACYICHCHLCQKRTGSAFSMSLVFPANAIELLEGVPRTSERKIRVGTVNRSSECPLCHSRLWTERPSSRTLNLRAGTLDNSADIRPVAQFWTSSAQRWAIHADILAYEEQPTDPTAMLQAWQASGQSL